MKNILIISSSPRKNGNSDMLCNRFMQGAEENGNKVEKVRIAEKKINYCLGCGYCNSTGKCSQKDDMIELLEKMQKADVIVLATPIYFYGMCGQLKTFIDRCCPAYTKIRNKDFYYIITAADTDTEIMDKVIESFKGFTIDCLPNATEKGIIYGLGAWQVGEVKKLSAYNEAYEMGKKA